MAKKAEPYLPHLRLAQLHDVSGEDLEFEQDLFNTFNEQFDASIAKLDEALKKNDKGNAVLYAHDIKGAARNLGADELGRVAKDAEEAARDTQFDRVRLLLPQLQTAFASLKESVAKYVKQRKDSA